MAQLRAANVVHICPQELPQRKPGHQKFERMDACFLHAAQALREIEMVLVLTHNRSDCSSRKAAHTATIVNWAAKKRLRAESTVLRQVTTGMLAVC